MKLTERDLARSLAIGDFIREGEEDRLFIHGFLPTAHGCYVRGAELPRGRAAALAVCADEANEARAALLGEAGQLVARDQVGEGEEEAAEQRGAGVHGPGVRTSAANLPVLA